MKFTIDVSVKSVSKYWINASTIYTIEGMLKHCEERGYVLSSVTRNTISWACAGSKYASLHFNRATLCET